MTLVEMRHVATVPPNCTETSGFIIPVQKDTGPSLKAFYYL